MHLQDVYNCIVSFRVQSYSGEEVSVDVISGGGSEGIEICSQ